MGIVLNGNKIVGSRKNVAALAAVVLCLVVGVIVSCSSDKVRHKFYFMSYDTDKVCSEVRYVAKKTGDESVREFIEELLIGPMTNRYKMLFARETTVDFCFSKGKELYVGLSDSALKVTAGNAGILESVGLLRKNIVKNFTGFNKIFIYVDGQLVYDEK